MAEKLINPAMIVDVYTKEREGKDNYTIVTVNIMGGQYRLMSEVSEADLKEKINIYGGAMFKTIERTAIYNEYGRDVTAIGEFPNRMISFIPNAPNK